MIKRIVKLSKTKSFFLFGPRSTGKTTLLRDQYQEPENLWIDLLNTQIERQLRHNPEVLEDMISKANPEAFIIIDEIQKIPKLLDVIHRLIFQKKQRFILTGSSARKLKRGSANLLAGRAFNYKCHPLTSIELAHRFDLNSVMRFGSLPEISFLNDEDKKDYLRSYVEVYFKEEIVAEQLIRNLIPFKNFLEVASQANTKIVNMNRIATTVDVDHTTVKNYFTILEDTLVGFLLPAYHTSIRQRQRLKPKFYYFDLGVQRALSLRLDIELTESNYEYGEIFEHFLILEVKRLIDYKKPDWSISYFRTADDTEVDLVIERPGQETLLVEIKSTNDINSLDQQKLIGFKRLAKDFPNSEAIVVSRDNNLKLTKDCVQYTHWKEFLNNLFF